MQLANHLYVLQKIQSERNASGMAQKGWKQQRIHPWGTLVADWYDLSPQKKHQQVHNTTNHYQKDDIPREIQWWTTKTPLNTCSLDNHLGPQTSRLRHRAKNSTRLGCGCYKKSRWKMGFWGTDCPFAHIPHHTSVRTRSFNGANWGYDVN
jgi:hypothetical protein